MEWKVESKTILTRGSEFLTAWISWSRNWATTSRTTTSRKPQRWSLKNLRWKRMYLLLRADQKAEAKPRKRTSACSSTRTVPICDISWTDIEPGTYSHIAFPVSKTTESSSSSWWSTTRRRWSDWILEICLRNDLERSQHWSDELWKSRMAGGGGHKKTIHYCTDSSRQILYLRALQGHWGRNPIDPSLQDSVLIPNDFFEYTYHIGCAINLHSITNSG